MDEILLFAKEAAKKAGAVQLGGFRSDTLQITYKSRTDLLTDIDTKCEELLYKEIRDAYPDHTIIAEEGSSWDSEGDYVWYIDPLDGTNNFAHGLPFFCVSLGVFSRKTARVEYGVVYNPFLDEMFAAQRGAGAWLNERKITCSDIKTMGVALIATGFPYKKDDLENNNLREFNAILPNIQGIRRMGAAALDLCYVACGRLDGYWESQLKSWDVAAGSLVVEEAGGLISDFSGGAFTPETGQIVATNEHLHSELIGFVS